MVVRTIKTDPDPVLRKKAKRVPELDVSLQKFIDDMIQTMKAAYGVGLAAPQVGVSLRIIVFELPDQKGVSTLVNPEIVKQGGERVCQEGCLSIPGFTGEIMRSQWVKVKGQDRLGRPVRLKAEDYLAQILQHEIDHLNGILYVDRMEDKSKLVPVVDESAEQASSVSEDKPEVVSS
ncbi:MAG: peptide deformylase [Dehalococcoidia bacterium]|nr:peptide deformylase [Dehalococcoidia bacterium]